MVLESSYTVLNCHTTLPVKIKRVKRLKNIYIRVYKEYIEVKAPYMTPKLYIEKLLKNQDDFIRKRYQAILNIKELEKENEILFLGTPLPLQIFYGYKKEHYIVTDDKIKLYLNNNLDKEKIRAKIYKDYAPQILLTEIKEIQKRMRLTPSKISFRKTKAQWGSCSAKDALSLNTYLVMLPKELREYIIVHELAHILHKNHSAPFWQEVIKYYPNYKEAKKALKEYSQILR